MPPSAPGAQTPQSEHVYEDDPDWLLYSAVYMYPDADTADERAMIRFDVAAELRAIRRRYSRFPATNVPSPGVITAIPSSRST
jgi:hypothetical protein